MTYSLLTGASGLLGGYLLRDCLLAGHHMAVLVRPTETQSARERIEGSLVRWEEQTGRVLPRPMVFEGDVHSPDLKLTDSDLRWIANHCDTVIHVAASLTFFGLDRRGDPWLTNVEGTRRMLDLCARCGTRHLHYVSTAYVCGFRKGPILETELDLGQRTGNDYECSKLEAERLVRSAALPRPPTVYRPSIILGDSQTGYTSTFRGFFAVLKLVHTLASQVSLRSATAKMVLRAGKLKGHDRKDCVPVDWVSAVMTHLLGRPEHYGKTYHLTAGEPTPVSLWSQVIQDAVEQYSRLADPSDATRRDAKWFRETFVSQSRVYRSYWRDDPLFDRTHTEAAAPQLPCPNVDYDMLLRMARFAISTDFGRRRQASGLRDGLLQTVVTPEGV
jgi:thioester reductase-like protein